MRGFATNWDRGRRRHTIIIIIIVIIITVVAYKIGSGFLTVNDPTSEPRDSTSRRVVKTRVMMG